MANFIDTDKTKHFVVLYRYIADVYGSIAEATKAIGVSKRVRQDLLQSRLTDVSARKILDCYFECKSWEE